MKFLKTDSVHPVQSHGKLVADNDSGKKRGAIIHAKGPLISEISFFLVSILPKKTQTLAKLKGLNPLVCIPRWCWKTNIIPHKSWHKLILKTEWKSSGTSCRHCEDRSEIEWLTWDYSWCEICRRWILHFYFVITSLKAHVHQGWRNS